MKMMEFDKDIALVDTEQLLVNKMHARIIKAGHRSDIPSKHRWWEYGFAVQELNASGNLQGRILDIGSGYSPLGPTLATLGAAEVYEYDAGADWLKDRHSMYAGLNLHMAAFDRLTRPMPDGSFQAITCVSVLEHCNGEERQAIIEHAISALASGGIFYITCDLESMVHKSRWRSMWQEPYLNYETFQEMIAPLNTQNFRSTVGVDSTYYEDLDAEHDYSFIKAAFIKP